MSQSHATIDHEVIRRWVESRKGHPAVVRATHRGRDGADGVLRIDFDPPEESLERVSWEDFFRTFDESELAFLFQDETASGNESRFNKFVSRESAGPLEASRSGGSGKSKSH